MGFLLIFSAGRHEPEPVFLRAMGEDAVKEVQDLLHRASDGRFREAMSPVDARSRGF
jgi:hypothetical protein